MFSRWESITTVQKWFDTNNYKCPSRVDKTNWIGGEKHDYVYQVHHPNNRVNVHCGNCDGPNGGWRMNLRFRCCPK